ncbi:N-6 DNA methylase [Anaerolineales bacterium HSG6]|nr:N-6 DNA methylase [Anaerolineales bacterium HSG6]
MNLIQAGIDKGLISFDEDRKYITYIRQNKRRNYTRPEESVQAETFLKLILVYGYDPERVEQFVSVTIGSDTREADIIVYNDDAHVSAHIVVECKKEDVSEQEFEQAIKQAFSYAATGTVRAKYFWVTSGIKDAYFEIPKKEPKKYQSVPDVPQFGVDKLAKYKYVKGGGVVNGQKLFDLEVVTEDELTRRFKQAHNSLWGGGELNPSEAFDELDKLIFCKIWDEDKPRKVGQAYDFQIISENSEDKTNQELQKRIHALYDEGRKKDPEVFKDSIRLSVEKLRTVVGYLESIHLGNTDLDSKGRAFETFMGSFFRGDFGQYFTPRPIVKFIVDTLPITNDSIVLDTSCGSGGFLLHALDKVRQKADDYYTKGTIEHYNYWHNFAEKNLFGIEINEQIARTAKMNMIIHDDGHTNVIAADGLLPIDDVLDEDRNVTQQGIYSRTYNRGFVYGRFDFIITNPPFGSSIKQTEQAYMRQYGYALSKVDWLNLKSKETKRTNQSTEVLFIEQCHNYLTEGGYLAIVLPDGVLTNSSLQYVRDEIEEMYRIVAVVSLPQTAFQATGAGVKSSVLFLKKHTTDQTKAIRLQRVVLQDNLKKEYDYIKQLRQIEADKKEHLKALTGFDNPDGLQGKALTQSEAYKAWRREVNAIYKEKVDALKETLSEQYTEQLRKVQTDYPIFMAIAEDIGYDATGKPTQTNELDYIGQELARFIKAIEGGKYEFSIFSRPKHR